MFFLSFIKYIHCYLFFLIMVVGFTIQAMILFPVGVRVFGNTIRVFHDHQVVCQGNMHILGANIYLGGIIPTGGLEHGPNLLNQHQALNHLVQHHHLHLGGGSPGIILHHSNLLSSLPIEQKFILNGELNCVTSFMNFLSVSVLFSLKSFLCYVHH